MTKDHNWTLADFFRYLPVVVWAAHCIGKQKPIKFRCGQLNIVGLAMGLMGRIIFSIQQ
jgi:hypothetical protein